MKGTIKYVGLDVHQATTVASVREESGRVIARAILPTEPDALLEFFGGMRGAVHVAFEEGTQQQWLHELLTPRVHRVLVCDRRGEPKQGNKADSSDADQLSELLRRGGLRVVAEHPVPGADAHRTDPGDPADPVEIPDQAELWGYAGLAVVTYTSAEYMLVDGRPVRRRRAPMTRGLNRNHNRILKDVFKAAATAASARPGALQDFYRGMIARGVKEELARVTLARKPAAITLRLWKESATTQPS